MKEIRILVTGSRAWMDYSIIERELLKASEGRDPVIIHGGAKGADTIAGHIATIRKWKVTIFPADWERFGHEAGPKRNAQMLACGGPEIILAFWDGESTGTRHMINLAQASGLPVKLFTRNGENVPALFAEEGNK